MIDKVGGKSVKWFGKWLKDWRIKNNITQKQVAELFPSSTGNLTGCVANWELGMNVPTPEQFTKIVNHFNLPFQTLEQAEREIVGKLKTNTTLYKEIGNESENSNINITKPKTDLAKKYDGYKYSVAPLKQTCETIMVFKKPNKTGSVLHDTLALEAGDTTISVSALNIDGNKVVFVGKDTRSAGNRTKTFGKETAISGGEGSPNYTPDENGRYPAQSFVDEQVASRLDLQSSISKGGKTYDYSGIKEYDEKGFLNKIKPNSPSNYGDVGGASKILHKIKYELYDHDLFIYEPKVGEAERNNGLEAFESKLSANLPMRSANVDSDSVANDGSKTHRTTTTKNNHPTLKPIDLNSKVLKLFKTPNDQKICYPFAGSGSEIIGGLQAGFSHWVACEINEDYIKIANARIKHYTTHEYVEVPLFDE
jgi:site-specific DNA-methyltransferase (adenine-specific)